ncbi:MAG: MFS transporter [Acidimicrobiia bacterium]
MIRSQLKSRPITGWVLYDLANTVFALGVIGLYFPAFLLDSGGRDGALALAEAGAGIAVIFLAPRIGGVTDRSGRRLPWLAVTTGIAVVTTAFLGSVPLFGSLLLLALGLVGFNLGSAIYDALLPSVSTVETRARISGRGVGIGYLGSFLGLGLGRFVLEVLDGNYRGVFVSLAAAFVLFAIPIFVWVKESPPVNRVERPLGLLAAWRAARSVPGMVRFLIGRFLYTDAINTLIGGFLALFVITELGLSTSAVNTLLAIAIAAAIAGGFLGGRLTEIWGPRRSLRLVLLLWTAAIIAGIVAAAFDVPDLVWIVGVLGGVALGATWASDRVLMLELSPPDRIGEFYGLYAIMGRFATILSPLLWALIVDVLGLGRLVAMAALAGFVLAGWWVLRR